MVSPLHQFSLVQLLLGAAFIVVILAVVQRWALQRLNAEPDDDLDNVSGDKDAEILGDVPVRSKVGTPRPRRLQPARSISEESEMASSLSGPNSAVPVESLAMTGTATAIKPSEPARNEPVVPIGGGSLPSPAFASVGSKGPDKPVENKPAEPAGKPLILPPLSPIDAAVVGGGTKAQEPVKASTDKPVEPVPLPPLSVNLPPVTASPAMPVEAKDKPATVPVKAEPALPVSPLSPGKPMSIPPAEPLVEKVADGVVAIGQPVPLAAAPAGADDVKKSAAPPVGPPAGENKAGLVLIPKGGEVAAEAVTAVPIGVVPPKEPAKVVPPPAEPVKPVEVPAVADKKDTVAPAKPVEPVTPVTPVVPVPEKKPEPPAKTGWRPRIFLPANLPAKEKPAEVVKPAPVAATPAAPVEAKTPAKVEAKEAVPAPAVESKPAPKPKVEPEPSVAPVPTLPPAKPAEPMAAKSETPTPASKETVKPEPAVPVAKVDEPKVPAAKAPAPVTAVPAVEVKPPAPVAEERLKTPSSEPKTPAVAPAAAPVTPVPVPTLPSVPAPVVAPVAQAVSISKPQPTMAQNESTTNVPANSRAAAQLTLGFEITSLQLTPFFKLGAVQLKPISNIVGLHLIASQSADNPLAAGISFQIDNVELNEASHVRSILLKPLQGGAQAAATPQSKLQVDAVQIGQGSEGAPISITSSSSATTAVQLLATFSIAAMDFTPSFEIGSLRLEPTSNSVLLRLAPSSRPAALDLPPSFEVANVQLGDNAQISGLSLTPGNKPA